MNSKAKKILIGTITFVFLFASAYIAQAMGIGGAGMYGAQRVSYPCYSAQMGYGMGGAGMYGARMDGYTCYSRWMGYGNNSQMGSANMGSHGGGYGSMGSHYAGSHTGGSN